MDTRTKSQRHRWMLLVVFLVSAVLLSTTAEAQVRGNSRIEGQITDDTGGSLPGVTITLTSPALQLGEQLAVSASDGTYRFPELPIGTYLLTYDLEGFTTLVREDITLTFAFTARVDVVLEVGALEESITVSGISPVVDVVSTSGGTTLTQELLSATPTSLNYQDVMALVSGVLVSKDRSLQNAIGGQNLTSGSNTTFGQPVRMGNWIEGMKAAQAETPDFLAVENMDVRSYGNTAEIDGPGSSLSIIYKSGGNQFHGRLSGDYQNDALEWSNIDDTLRDQGITSPQMEYVYKTGQDLGGPIVQDKLWFYVAHAWAEARAGSPGLSLDPGPDGVYFNADDTPITPKLNGRNMIGKLTYQATNQHKFIVFGQRDPVWEEVKLGGNRSIPYEAQRESTTLTTHYKVEWQGLFGNNVFANLLAGKGGYNIEYRPHLDLPLSTCRSFRDTGVVTGNGCWFFGFVRTFGSGTALAPYLDRSPIRSQYSGGLTFYRASHELKTGWAYLPGRLFVTVPDYSGYADVADTREDGLYQLIYDRVPGGPYEPVEFLAADVPTAGGSRQNNWSFYLSDTWRATDRLTVNAGIRWERVEAYVEPQVKEQGLFGFGGTFPQLEIGDWSGFAPRIGAAFDVSGDGKTVAKAAYGLYQHADFNNFGNPLTLPAPWNKNSPSEYTYIWRDQDGNNEYTPGEVDLDVNGPDFLRVRGPSNNAVNPDLDWGRTHELSASIERELVPNVALRGLYVYKKVVDEIRSRGFVNVARPYDVYNQVFTRRDPGPDGVLDTGDDGGSVTLYDYDPAYRGADFVETQILNVPDDRTDSYQNVEIQLLKRPGTGGWYADTAILFTKNHRWLTGFVANPNLENFRLDETWDTTFRLAGGYELPYAIRVSTLYQIISGLHNQRTNLFRRDDPDGGPSFPSSGSITVPVEEYGTQSLPTRHLMNLRFSKFVALGGTRLRLDLDVYNLFNINTPYTATYRSGPTFGNFNRIAAPRVVRLGFNYTF